MHYTQMLRFEWEQILHNRIFYLLFAAFLFINGICLYGTLHTEDATSNDLSLSEYQTAYSQFLSEIDTQSQENKTIQLFQKDPYTLRNIAKTAKDYQSMQHISINWYGGRSLTLVLRSSVTDILMVLLLSYCILLSILDMKRNGMLSFLRTMPNGRERLALAKLHTLFVLCLFVVLIFYGMNVAFANPCSISWQSPLPCLSGYMRSTWQISIGTYLILYLLLKWLALSLITFLLFLLGCLTTHMIYYYSAILGIGAVSGLCYTLGSHVGNMEFLKYFNLLFFYATGKATALYYNYNLFGYPVSVHIVNAVCIVAFLILLTIWGCKSFASIHKEYRPFSLPWKKKQSVSIGQTKKRQPQNVLAHTECYKLFYGNRILIFFVLVCLLQLYQYSNQSGRWYQDELYYRNYITMVEGTYTEDKWKLLQEEKDKISAATEEFDKLDAQFNSGQITQSYYSRMTEPYLQEMQKADALDRAMNYVSYIGTLDEHAGILYTRGWEYLHTNTISSKNMRTLFLYMLCIILSLSGIYAQEYQHSMTELLHTYPYENRSGRDKRLLILAICTGFFVLLYMPELLWTFKEYSLHGGEYSLASIPCFGSKYSAIPIILFYIILYVLRLAFGILSGWIVSLTGRHLKNTSRTIFLYIIILGIAAIVCIII